MEDLRRHRLVRLDAAGWRRARAQHVGPEAERCIAHWTARDLPLVVTTQPVTREAGICLGLAAPAAWGRPRLCIRVAPEHLRSAGDEFPLLWECSALPWSSRRTAALRSDLGCHALSVRVYGSFGWQHVTRLGYVRQRSDIDLSLSVADGRQADDVAALLLRIDDGSPRLDGEISFPDGSAVAWREWLAWRSGRVATILVKRLRGAALEAGSAWLPLGAPLTAEIAS